MNSVKFVLGHRRFYFVGGATIPWQCADSLGGASIREGASNRGITAYEILAHSPVAEVIPVKSCAEI